MYNNRSDEDWQRHAEQKLWELIDGAETITEKVDKDGQIHQLRAKLPPNTDAVKFALKNRTKGKWADKTEVTSTQINVNLTASYDEVKKLMEQETQKLLAPTHDDDIIDALAYSTQTQSPKIPSP